MESVALNPKHEAAATPCTTHPFWPSTEGRAAAASASELEIDPAICDDTSRQSHASSTRSTLSIVRQTAGLRLRTWPAQTCAVSLRSRAKEPKGVSYSQAKVLSRCEIGFIGEGGGRLPTSYATTLGLMPPARARGCGRKD